MACAHKFFLFIEIALFFGLVLIIMPQMVKAAELMIHDQGELTISSGGILQMNCNRLTVKSGGTLLVDGGAIKQLGPLVIEPGGTYTIYSGTVERCFYPISHILLLLLED